ncbi:MAG TPA: HEAT repeat domain-containing protein [Anaerolineales bacterium]|nr:HEAT repeat domain-containing protein [Anaerolineales bacterium]
MSSLDDLLEELRSGEEARAESAAFRLAQLGTTAFPALVEQMASPEADHRWWAIRTLAQMSDADTSYFINALEDTSAEVRQAAALALAMHPTERAAPALVQALSDRDGIMQTLAANALSRIGKPVVPALLEEFPRASISAKIHLMQVLSEIRDPRAIPVMMNAMEEDSAILSHWCEVGLQGLGLDMVYLKLG